MRWCPATDPPTTTTTDLNAGCKQHWAPDASRLCPLFYFFVEWLLYVLCFVLYWGGTICVTFAVVGGWYNFVQTLDPKHNLTQLSRSFDTQLVVLDDHYRKRIASSNAKLRELVSYQPQRFGGAAHNNQRNAAPSWFALMSNPNCIIA